MSVPEKLFTLPPDLARAIAARRRPKAKVCPVCGQGFVTIGRGAYCSPRCKKVAYRLRQRAARTTDQATTDPATPDTPGP